jgi:hypothetical protein
MLETMEDRGYGWAGNLLEMVEKFGARNAVPGYETARLEIIHSQLPRTWMTASTTLTVETLFPGPKEQMSLKESGVKSLFFSADGTTLSLTLHRDDGTSMIMQIPYPKTGRGEDDGSPLRANLTQKFISESLIGLGLDVNKTGAERIAKALGQDIISAVPADRSYDAYKALLQHRRSLEMDRPEESRNEKLMAGLDDSLQILGQDYDQFIINTTPTCDMTSDEHDALYGETHVGPGSPDEMMLEVYDDLRSDFLDATVRVPLEPMSANEPHEAKTDDEVGLGQIGPSDFTEARPSGPDRPAALAQDAQGAQDAQDAQGTASPSRQAQGSSFFVCKVCSRAVKSRTSVAGIGPKCAAKLRRFIENPLSVSTSMTGARPITDIEREYKTNGDARRYPIMLVRSQGATFVADVVEKLSDGSFLMIDWTRLAKIAGTKKDYQKNSPTKRATVASFVGELGIVAGGSDLEVIKVFGE